MISKYYCAFIISPTGRMCNMGHGLFIVVPNVLASINLIVICRHLPLKKGKLVTSGAARSNCGGI
jgi:hypothetical protein